jgi:exopolyphosphatase / guanosine-5'-triphosphate,3'-diphosphate pyrophosphatase
VRIGTAMKAAVIDVGSNTIRLLIAESSECGLSSLEERRAQVGLGRDVEDQGRVSKRKMRKAAVTVREFVTRAQEHGCSGLVVAVTSPGLQATNADQLISQLERETTSQAVVVLSGEQEAQFAWDGAVSRCGSWEGSLLVCDVGGGSTELAFGTRPDMPLWLHSIDIGSLRLSRRIHADERLTKKRLATGWAEVEAMLENSPMPAPLRAAAVGGSARAVSRIAGQSLGAGQLSDALHLLRIASGSKGRCTKHVVIDPARRPTVAAGALILAALQRRVAVPLEFVGAGLREGLALSVLAQCAAR